MGSYAVGLLFVWAVFEKRLNVLYRHHIDKCSPFAAEGLTRVDKHQRVVIRLTMLSLLALSLGIIYFMTN